MTSIDSAICSRCGAVAPKRTFSPDHPKREMPEHWVSIMADSTPVEIYLLCQKCWPVIRHFIRYPGPPTEQSVGPKSRPKLDSL